MTIAGAPWLAVPRRGGQIARRLLEGWWTAGPALAVQWHLLLGDGAAAVRAQARLIRFAPRYRESLAAYERLDALVARHGDAGLDLAPHAERPDKCVFFIGYSRSGHSLVGSLLDAHPDIAVAHELHALKHLAAGRSFDAVARAMQYNALIFQRLGRHYSGYDYHVPDQHQGFLRRPVVVGDKKGNGTARLLLHRPDLIDLLERELPVPYVFVHVLRNPYDNITTKALRTGRHLDASARRYFANADLVTSLKRRIPERIVDVYLDDLIADPQACLEALLGRLGVEADADYLQACASILFKEPSRTRGRLAWPRGLVEEVDAQLTRYPFLARFAGGFDAAN